MHLRDCRNLTKSILALFFKRIYCLLSMFPVPLPFAAISSSEFEFAFLTYPLEWDLLWKCNMQVSFGMTCSSLGSITVLARYQLQVFMQRVSGLLHIQFKLVAGAVKYFNIVLNAPVSLGTVWSPKAFFLQKPSWAHTRDVSWHDWTFRTE